MTSAHVTGQEICCGCTGARSDDLSSTRRGRPIAHAALVVLGRAGYRVPTFPRIVLRWGTWGLVALLALSALGNSLSASPWERFLMAPAALALALLCLIVARGGREAA